jgi:hypothetical protein
MSYIFGSLLGSLIPTFILYFGARHFLIKQMINKKAAFIASALIASLIIMLITSFTMGLINGLINYSPGLLFWFVTDYVKSEIKKEAN